MFILITTFTTFLHVTILFIFIFMLLPYMSTILSSGSLYFFPLQSWYYILALCLLVIHLDAVWGCTGFRIITLHRWPLLIQTLKIYSKNIIFRISWFHYFTILDVTLSYSCLTERSNFFKHLLKLTTSKCLTNSGLQHVKL